MCLDNRYHAYNANYRGFSSPLNLITYKSSYV